MRALHAYTKSDPSRLVYEDAPMPTLDSGDVLVRVQASGISPAELDWNLTWQHPDGTPRVTPIIPGHEVSGIVDAIGPDAGLGLATGDEVFGLIDFHRDGGDAEFVAVRAVELVPKPAALGHSEAATVPLSGLTAWQALFEHADLQPGQRVLIHGGAGGVGSFAVQLARWRGAHVMATSSPSDVKLVRKLGADVVIDYRTQRFEDHVADLDAVFDTVGGETWERSWGVLRPGGRLVTIAVPRPPDRTSTDGRRSIYFIVRPDRETLLELADLLDEGSVRPVVSSVMPLSNGPDAYGPRRRSAGPGKAVLLVGEVTTRTMDASSGGDLSAVVAG